MEVAPTTDFDFGSSNRGFYYTSAPSSPTRLTELYCGFDQLLIAAGSNHIRSLATVPFAWEEKPGVPKTPTNLSEDDFSFDVSCRFDQDSLPAEDFTFCVIKTDDFKREKMTERERGRARGLSSSRLPSSRSRRTRSLSPLGASNYSQQQQQQQQQKQQQTSTTLNTTIKATPTPFCSSENGSRKWSIKDLFLFRSHSDGRAMEKDPLKKYSTKVRKQNQDLRSSPESGSVSKRTGRVSAHEIHYNMNRANSNDMKKKTYLPYKHGILGGLSFNP